MEVGGLVGRKCTWGWSCEWHMTKSRYVLTVAFDGMGKLEPIKQFSCLDGTNLSWVAICKKIKQFNGQMWYLLFILLYAK